MTVVMIQTNRRTVKLFTVEVMIAEDKCYTQCSTPLQTPDTCQVNNPDRKITHLHLSIPVPIDELAADNFMA